MKYRKLQLFTVYFPLLLTVACLAAACDRPQRILPVLGEKDILDGDTIFHRIGEFSLLNQDSQLVDNRTFEGHVYVADFFFISCPTICPKTTKQMLRIHDAFLDEPRVLLLAHTVDPKRDTVEALRRYARNLGVHSDKWHFVTGDKMDLYGMADDYFSVAMESPDAPGGFDHSGRLILVDEYRRVRSFCDGTDPEDVDRFIADIQDLLREK
ncbi:MAG: hypothetical protein RLY31_515 [Bacteroidota bacterium]|jgi:protein SCO1/2